MGLEERSERVWRRTGLTGVQLAGVLLRLHMLLSRGVLDLQRTSGLPGPVVQLHKSEQGSMRDATADQTQDVDQKTHEGQREGEDADEEPRRGSARTAGVPST